MDFLFILLHYRFIVFFLLLLLLLYFMMGYNCNGEEKKNYNWINKLEYIQFYIVKCKRWIEEEKKNQNKTNEINFFSTAVGCVHIVCVRFLLSIHN